MTIGVHYSIEVLIPLQTPIIATRECSPSFGTYAWYITFERCNEFDVETLAEARKVVYGWVLHLPITTG